MEKRLAWIFAKSGVVCICLVLLLSSCATGRDKYLSPAELVGFLNNNGFGPDNTRMFVGSGSGTNVLKASPSLNYPVWELFENGKRIDDWEPQPYYEIKILGAGASGTFWMNAANEAGFELPHQDLSGALKCGFSAIYHVPGVYETFRQHFQEHLLHPTSKHFQNWRRAKATQKPKLLSLLETNDLAETNTTMRIIVRRDGMITGTPVADTTDFWLFFQYATPLELWEWHPYVFYEIELKSSQGRGTIWINASSRLAISFGEYSSNWEMPCCHDGAYLVPGLYEWLEANYQDSQAYPFE